MPDRPKVGVGVIVLSKNKVLLGKRKSPHGDGTWSFPGGHLEYGETPEECALRELAEESGLTKVTNIRRGPYTNDVFDESQKHYITLHILMDLVEGEAVVMEPDKLEQWQWFDWNHLPSPLFLPQKNLLKQNFNPLF